MGKIVITSEAGDVREIELDKENMLLGRRPYCDVLLDQQAVSGEHALIRKNNNAFLLEDLNSTNGTYLKGKAIKRHVLSEGDEFKIAKFKIRFTSGAQVPVENAMSTGLQKARLKVVSGPAAGQEIPLTKPHNTVGKPGIAVVIIGQTEGGFLIAHVEGASVSRLNTVAIGLDPLPLKNNDTLEIAGIQMLFTLSLD